MVKYQKDSMGAFVYRYVLAKLLSTHNSALLDHGTAAIWHRNDTIYGSSCPTGRIDKVLNIITEAQWG